MNKRTTLLLTLAVMLTIALQRAATSPAAAQNEGGVTSLISRHSNGAQGNHSSSIADISADGRWVAFQSGADNLVDDDTNGQSDVFVHDRRTSETALISRHSDGTLADGPSNNPHLSADGRYVVFSSSATNLVDGDTQRCSTGLSDFNCSAVFIHDRTTGETARLSVDSNGVPANGESYGSAISADGKFVAFVSEADNLVAGDTNGEADIFVHDLTTGTTSRVSVNSTAGQALGASSGADLSADGRLVAFDSVAGNLVSGDTNGHGDVFVHDRQTGETSLISRHTTGALADRYSSSPSISADGRVVAFSSSASNLVDGFQRMCGEYVCGDIFVHDRQTGETTLVSRHTGGASGNGYSAYPALSPDGRFVAFDSTATNLIDNDANGATSDVFLHELATGETTLISRHTQGAQGTYNASMPALSANAGVITFSSSDSRLIDGDTGDAFNMTEDVFAHDRTGQSVGETSLDEASDQDMALPDGSVELVSRHSDGTPGNGNSIYPSLSADARFVAFTSEADNLVDDDVNARADVFLHDRLTGETTLVSQRISGVQGNLDSFSGRSAISADGRFITFHSQSYNLVDDATDDAWSDVFVYDRLSLHITLISRHINGSTGNGDSYDSHISADGRYVAFTSDADNLVDSDSNSASDVFLYDRQTGVTALVSRHSDGTQGALGSSIASLSADGRYVVFHSGADNLIANDTTPQWAEVFVHDRQTGETTLVSRHSSGAQGNNISAYASISADGRLVAFPSAASNLVDSDSNGYDDVFLHHRETGMTELVSRAGDGTPGNGRSGLSNGHVRIAADGSRVAYVSLASNLVSDDNNGGMDVFLYDVADGQTTLISRHSNGAQGNQDSRDPSISANGRIVAFGSVADNLVDGDTNGHSDIFIYTQTGEDQPAPDDGQGPPSDGFVRGSLTLVPRLSDGTQGNSFSDTPSVSVDGRFIAFRSGADNLVAGDTNGGHDIFVLDRQTDEMTLVSRRSDGTIGNGGSYDPVISADGRFVAFTSIDDSLVEDDTNEQWGGQDVFLHDRQTGQTTLVSRRADGSSGRGASWDPAISADGRLVTFDSSASALDPNFLNPLGVFNVYLYDRDTEQVTLFPRGTTRLDNARAYSSPSLSADGRFIAVTSSTADQVRDAPNGPTEILVHDRQTGETTLIAPRMIAGTMLGQGAGQATLSANGRFVAFRDENDDESETLIFLHDRQTDETRIVVRFSSSPITDGSIRDSFALSADGRYLLFRAGANGLVDTPTGNWGNIFLYDQQTELTVLISADAQGRQGINVSRMGAISADGRVIVFSSVADNLVSDDRNEEEDVFIYDAADAAPPTPQANAIAGRATDAAGAPLAGVEIRAAGPDQPRTATTDGEGRYRFDDLPDGGYTLTAALPGYTFTAPLEVTLPPAQLAADFHADPVDPAPPPTLDALLARKEAVFEQLKTTSYTTTDGVLFPKPFEALDETAAEELVAKWRAADPAAITPQQATALERLVLQEETVAALLDDYTLIAEDQAEASVDLVGMFSASGLLATKASTNTAAAFGDLLKKLFEDVIKLLVRFIDDEDLREGTNNSIEVAIEAIDVLGDDALDGDDVATLAEELLERYQNDLVRAEAFGKLIPVFVERVQPAVDQGVRSMDGAQGPVWEVSRSAEAAAGQLRFLTETSSFARDLAHDLYVDSFGQSRDATAVLTDLTDLALLKTGNPIGLIFSLQTRIQQVLVHIAATSVLSSAMTCTREAAALAGEMAFLAPQRSDFICETPYPIDMDDFLRRLFSEGSEKEHRLARLAPPAQSSSPALTEFDTTLAAYRVAVGALQQAVAAGDPDGVRARAAELATAAQAFDNAAAPVMTRLGSATEGTGSAGEMALGLAISFVRLDAGLALLAAETWLDDPDAADTAAFDGLLAAATENVTLLERVQAEVPLPAAPEVALPIVDAPTTWAAVLGEAVALPVQVSNAGSRPFGGALLTLEADGHPLATQALPDLAPGESAEVMLEYAPDAAGHFRLRVNAVAGEKTDYRTIDVSVSDPAAARSSELRTVLFGVMAIMGGVLLLGLCAVMWRRR